MSIDQEREQAHAYLDRLPPAQLSAVRSLLATMIASPDRFPAEDEEIGVEEERAVVRSKEWLRHNEPIPMEDVLAEFGLNMADFQRMGETPLSDPGGPDR